eukprot:m.24225 g.24225  ORF g.24225 m.24225 type:complete len:860 (-) comp9539_c0_seq1:189-2768(-)
MAATGAAEMPEGMLPIFFTTATQELFACRVDVDVTEQQPHKLIPIERILQDFVDRAAVSDFHPCKAEMQAYTGSEVLVVFDPDFVYGQNFFMFLTEDSKTKFLQKEVQQEDKVIEEAAQELQEAGPEASHTKREGGWVSLQSEQEVEDLTVKTNRPLINVILTRRRRYFGAPFSFKNSKPANSEGSLGHAGGADFASVKITSEDEQAPADVFRKLADAAIQSVPNLRTTGAQTNWPAPQNAGVQYAPLALQTEEAETIMQSGEIGSFLNDVAPRVMQALDENLHMDLHVDDFGKLRPTNALTLGNKEDNKLKEQFSFKYLDFQSVRNVTALSWYPGNDWVIAVAYASQSSFDERIEKSADAGIGSSLVLIWSFYDSIVPLMRLEAPDDIFSIEFCPTNPKLLAGGCINGQLVLWDLEAQACILDSDKGPRTRADDTMRAQVVRHTAVSSIEGGHRACVYGLNWLQPYFQVNKLGRPVRPAISSSCQLCTVSCDGTALIWDVRPNSSDPSVPLRSLDLNWTPILKIYLSWNSSDIGGMSLSLRPVAHAAMKEWATSSDKDSSLKPPCTKFFVGTELGQVAYLDWIPPESESGKLGMQVIERMYEVHSAKAASITRSPFFSDLVLSVSGASFCLIKEDLKDQPVFEWNSANIEMTCGAWSQTRAAVFFIGKADGTVDIWDIVDSSYAPALTQTVCSPMSITTFLPQKLVGEYDVTSTQLAAVGDVSGVLHVLDIPLRFKRQLMNETALTSAFLDKEMQRLAYFNAQSKTRPVIARKISDNETFDPQIKDPLASPGSVKANKTVSVISSQDDMPATKAPAQPMTTAQKDAFDAREEELKLIYETFKKDQERFLEEMGLVPKA